MLPDIEGQYRLKAAGDGVAGVGFLGNHEGATGGGRKPDPAGAEESDSLSDEIGLEGVDGTPLLLDLRFDPARRPFGRLKGRRLELGEVQVVVQDLAGVVEDAAIGLGDDLFQRHRLELGAGDETVEVIDIGLQMLAMVKADGLGADDRCQRIRGIG